MQWNIDAGHSSIEFGVRHMGISTVRGRFTQFEATPELNEAGILAGVSATLDVASIDTGVEQRDDHLRSPDFFDVAQHPTMEFRSTKVERRDGRSYRVSGDLTMKGVTRPVTLDVEVSEPVKDPWGNKRVAAEATGKLDRTAWGLKWNQVLEFGALLVSEEVKFTIAVQAVAQVPAAV
ncbi:MAG: YceI family protein [Gemmatimonadales bacterium]|nr:YceI family protein [Gemmatimonadales bacterium]